MGPIVTFAWIVMTLAYIGQFILRLDLRWLEKEYQPIWHFLGMALFFLLLPSLFLNMVTTFGGVSWRAIGIFVPLGVLAMDLATWFKPDLLAAWLIGIHEKQDLWMILKRDRLKYKAITRWQRPWRKYFWRWVFIGPPLAILAGYFEWLILNSIFNEWW